MALIGNVVLADTGPLVAWIERTELHHDWAKEQFAQLQPPLLTCEPVLSEAAFLLERHGQDPAAILDLVERNILNVAFTLDDNVKELTTLMRRYRNVPMSLADACLVRMSEIHRKCRVMTTDSDFRVYRRNSRTVIPLLAPW